jgi:hypothetical protein
MKATKLILSMALLFALAGPAFAEDQPSGGGHIRQACAADLQKFCPNAQSRDDRRQCLQSNKDQLSGDCKKALTSASAHWHHDQGQGNSQNQGGSQ